MNFYDEIIGSNTWVKVEMLNKGWSNDKKYHIQTKEGTELLLRVSDISQFEAKQKEYESIKLLDSINILMSRPIDFGICNHNKLVYLLLTWITGEEAETAIKTFSDNDQYVLGFKAGEYLREIHKLPAPDYQMEWLGRFNRKIDRNIMNYKSCGIYLKNADKLINYINTNRDLLRNRPQCFQHGDYHVGNMIITHSGELGIIDVNRFDYGDPWEEFNRIVWCVNISRNFASGYINGYFENNVPDLFFRLIALYIASNQLSSIPWAIQFGQEEISIMINQAQSVIDWYEGFTVHIPKWYFTKD